MADFKLNFADPKSGKTLQKELKDPQTRAFMGKRIGDSVRGDDFGYAGYSFEITGGSDYCGFPMRKGVTGSRRKKVLIGKSVGFRGKQRKLRKGKSYRRKDGIRRRKSVCPDNIGETIVQINLKVLTSGKGLFEESQKESVDQSSSDAIKNDDKKVKESATDGVSENYSKEGDESTETSVTKE